MKEIWTNVLGYGGAYEVSTWGRIRNQDGDILTPYKNEKGYMKIGLTKNGKCSKHRVHRLVAQAFIPNVAHYPEVNHKDGNKENNSVTNLEWVSANRNREHEGEFKERIAYNIRLCREINTNDT